MLDHPTDRWSNSLQRPSSNHLSYAFLHRRSARPFPSPSYHSLYSRVIPDQRTTPMITFTPLSSSSQVASSSSAATPPLAYLIQLDDIKILVDCGSPDLRRALEGNEPEGEYEKLLRSHAPSVDLVLLTHSSLIHLGYYPFARSQLGLTCPVYATVPVASMGRVSCADECEGWRQEMDGSLWEEDDVEEERKEVNDETETGGRGPSEVGQMEVDDKYEVKVETKVASQGVKSHGEKNGNGGMETSEVLVKRKMRRRKWVATGEEVVEAFEFITRVKYESPTRLMGALSSLTLTAFSSGHTLGGTIWKIRSPSSGTILHAVGMNHTKERHLDGTALLKEKGEGIHEGLGRPDLLITDVDRVQWKNVKRRERDGALLQLVTATLQSNGSLLFPVDPSTRLLELLILLDQHWSWSINQAHSQGRNWTYPLCLVSRTGKQMIDFARSLMEWMGGSVASGEAAGDGGIGRGRNAGEMRGHPLEFRHLRFYDSVAALTATYPASRPKLILAIPPSMSHGPSRTLFTQLAENLNALIVLTSRGTPNTLGSELFEMWNGRQERGKKAGEGEVGTPIGSDQKMDIEINTKVPLSGQELADHLEAIRLAAEKEAFKAIAKTRAHKLLEADEIESDEDDDSEGDSDADEGTSRPSKGVGNGLDSWDDAGGDTNDDRQVSFDIYVKGQSTRSATFFKSASASTAPRFRMFPGGDKDRRSRKIDLYGEAIDVGVWLRKGREIEEEVGETEFVRAAKKRRAEEEEKQKTPPEPPSKFIVDSHSIHARCGLYFADMEGLNDGRAVKTIVPQVNPRRLILVHGTSSAAEELTETCKALPTMTSEIYAPHLGESLRIGEDMVSYPLSLGDGLMPTLNMSKYEDYEIAQVTGRYTFPSNSTIPILEPSVPSIATSLTSTLSPTKSLSFDPSLPQALPTSLFIGDLKLTLLKTKLQRLGIAAEFVGDGVLVCGMPEGTEMDMDDQAAAVENEVVAVRKGKAGRIEIEGGAGDIYYRVRREVYGLHAVVSG